VCVEAGVPMVAQAYFSERDCPMPSPALGLQSGWWAPAWVFLALSTRGKRSHDDLREWLLELLSCEKRRVVIVMEALMLRRNKRMPWAEPAKIWLDEQKTTARGGSLCLSDQRGVR
jgi:hypothetical protein